MCTADLRKEEVETLLELGLESGLRSGFVFVVRVRVSRILFFLGLGLGLILRLL